MQRDHQRHGDAEDQQLDGRHRHGTETERDRLQAVRKADELAAEEPRRDFLQHDADADGADHRRQEVPAPSADRTEGDELDEDAE